MREEIVSYKYLGRCFVMDNSMGRASVMIPTMLETEASVERDAATRVERTT